MRTLHIIIIIIALYNISFPNLHRFVARARGQNIVSVRFERHAPHRVFVANQRRFQCDFVILLLLRILTLISSLILGHLFYRGVMRVKKFCLFLPLGLLFCFFFKSKNEALTSKKYALIKLNLSNKYRPTP
jgi:hypothetical protein